VRYRYCCDHTCAVPLLLWPYMCSTVIVVTIHVQYRYCCDHICAVPLLLWPYMCSTIIVVTIHVQYRYCCDHTCAVPLLLSDFSETWNLSPYFGKNTQILNFIKKRTVGVDLLRADGQTDMTKLIVVFRNFTKARKKETYFCVSMATPVTRTRHSVTLNVHCVSFIILVKCACWNVCPLYLCVNQRQKLLGASFIHTR